MIKSAVIIPTGNEIQNGTVWDIDSPEVMRLLLRDNPECQITRLCPVEDEEASICSAIRSAACRYELIVLIGGSGGGHRFSDTLGKDFTHSAMENLLTEKCAKEIIGYNGHLWCKLICGRYQGSLFINLPGPFDEAQAAMEAFCRSYSASGSTDIRLINCAMAEAVLAQYPKKHG